MLIVRSVKKEAIEAQQPYYLTASDRDSALSILSNYVGMTPEDILSLFDFSFLLYL